MAKPEEPGTFRGRFLAVTRVDTGVAAADGLLGGKSVIGVAE